MNSFDYYPNNQDMNFFQGDQGMNGSMAMGGQDQMQDQFNGNGQDEQAYHNGNGFKQNGKSFQQKNGNNNSQPQRRRNNNSQGNGNLEPEQFRKVFIGGLSYNTDSDAFRDYFAKFGEIIDHVVMKDGQTGKPKGFGFVTYAHSSMVDEMMKNRPHILDSRQVEPKRATPREDSGRKEAQISVKKLFIGGLRDNVSEEDLKTYFGKYGNIVEVIVMREKETNKSRGFGFINFDDYDPVDKIILERNHEINGIKLHCQKALPKDQQGGDGGAGGGGMGRGGGMGGMGGRGGGRGGNQGGFGGGRDGGNFGFGQPNFGNPDFGGGFGFQNGNPQMMGGGDGGGFGGGFGGGRGGFGGNRGGRGGDAGSGGPMRQRQGGDRNSRPAPYAGGGGGPGGGFGGNMNGNRGGFGGGGGRGGFRGGAGNSFRGAPRGRGRGQ